MKELIERLELAQTAMDRSTYYIGRVVQSDPDLDRAMNWAAAAMAELEDTVAELKKEMDTVNTQENT